MNDPDFWKHQYRDTWARAAAKENAIRVAISLEARRSAQLVGFGAGSSRFLRGSARAHGKERGGADLWIDGTNLYLEVTGPLSPGTAPEAPLWIRPDKIESARMHQHDRETWIVHELGGSGLRRAIRVDADFLAHLDAGDFPLVQPTINGASETYLQIPATDPHVRSWHVLIERIKAAPIRDGVWVRLKRWLRFR